MQRQVCRHQNREEELSLSAFDETPNRLHSLVSKDGVRDAAEYLYALPLPHIQRSWPRSNHDPLHLGFKRTKPSRFSLPSFAYLIPTLAASRNSELQSHDPATRTTNHDHQPWRKNAPVL